MEDYIEHYGTPRHSGRYPWGSGENPYQRNKSFLSYVQTLKDEGVSEKDIAKGMGLTTKQLRYRYSIAKDEVRAANVAEAIKLKDKGYSNVAIGEKMGINESTVRSLLNPTLQERASVTNIVADKLKEHLKETPYLDVGKGSELHIKALEIGEGSEQHIGVTRTKLETALEKLKMEGYEVHNIKVLQQGTGDYTTIQVLASPGATIRDVSKNRDKIGSLADIPTWSEDGGKSWVSIKPPKSISSDRIKVNYYEDGGSEKDGVIELRRGVQDISLGDSKYAQVRIAVDDSHYLKGMAVYSDDMPKGVDVIFNTNKHRVDPETGKKVSKLDTMKPLKDDPDNPFGSYIKRQQEYIDKDGNKVLSAINIVNEEGDWEGWKKSISSQVLSKQSPQLAKKQLDILYQSKADQYEAISAYTNPVVKKKLLMSFADECDKSAIHLEAAALPRQAAQVILPLKSIKDNEIYAPNYKDGERVALIRYPHGGKFEIPELIVNNRNQEGKKVITPSARDAVGISSKVANWLSGADFDGDTVLVIPNNKRGAYSIESKPPLPGVVDFEPKERYPGYPGMVTMTKPQKGMQMGIVSNLITDMTIAGATNDELARAVRHSMVVIDAEKHGLNWKQSALDNDISGLHKKYQGSSRGGAATLISRAKSPVAVPLRGREVIDKDTGKKSYIEKPKETYLNKDGKEVTRVSKAKKLEIYDAFDLSSGSVIESVYAAHSNKLKELANRARKEAVNTPNPKISISAKETYKEEVDHLKAQLNEAKKNSPLERKAQLVAEQIVKAKKEANPSMDKEQLKKVRGQALTEARARVGAKKKQIKISDREWEAIQAGAIGSTVLMDILKNTDETRIKELATPHDKPVMSASRISRARAMISAGCTQAEVADALGVSVSTLSRALNE